MSSEYGIFGEIKLEEWNSGVKRAFRALDRGEMDTAFVEAKFVIDSYEKHHQKTEKLVKVVETIAVISLALAALSGLLAGSWGVAFAVGIPGAALGGLIECLVVEKRMGLENDFYESYENLGTMLINNFK